MPRRPRLDMAGFHHIVNRGVARDSVYRCDEDKEKYLEILCKACKIYRVNVHDYCLMDNHYHLLIETTGVLHFVYLNRDGEKMKGICTPVAFVTSFGHMRKIKEILRLKCEAKLSNRKIARALNISHSVVNDYIRD